MKDLITLDFETYYDNDYTLKKLSTSEYICDERFLIHGVGIHCMGAAPYWVSGHDEALRACQDLELWDRPVLAHHMAFDGFILHQHAGIHVGQYCDTLSMARATMGHNIEHTLDNVAKVLNLGCKLRGLAETKGLRTLPQPVEDRLRVYCLNDVVLCTNIFERLRAYIPDPELRLIDLTIRMFCDPQLRLDRELLKLAYARQQAARRLAIENADTNLKVLNSNEQFAELLRTLGQEPPLKISPRTGKLAYAFAKTDEGFRALLNSPDEIVSTAAHARLLAKSTINENRTLRLLATKDPLPVYLNYAGAHTYRWSGGNKLNMQNLPRGGILRRAILAPFAHQLVVFDLSQIEARITAWISDQQDLVKAFAALDSGLGEDVYRMMAARIYNKPISAITSDERFIGKVCVLGMGFGMGWKKLQMTLAMGFMGKVLKIDEAFARRIVNIYRQTNQAIVQTWERLNVLLERMATDPGLKFQFGPLIFMYKMIQLPSGLALKYPGLRLEETGVSYEGRNGRINIWGGALLENIAQALARCVIGEQILHISDKYFVATMTHDEIVAVVPDAVVESAYKEIEQIMTTPPSWALDLPLAVEGAFNDYYCK
jgi:DNA polymerase